MKLRKTKNIYVDGLEVPAHYIGQGLFCKAYRNGDRVYLLCKGDFSKECISMFCDKTRKHIPHIDRHNNLEDCQVFSMPFYHKLTKLNYPQAYKDWKTLPGTITSYIEACVFIDSQEHNCPESLREAIRELVEAFSNYDNENMLLEFNKVNVGVNDNGELILRDCLASIKSMEAVRKEKQAKRKHAYL